jgi:hypothetical protein
MWRPTAIIVEPDPVYSSAALLSCTFVIYRTSDGVDSAGAERPESDVADPRVDDDPD